MMIQLNMRHFVTVVVASVINMIIKSCHSYPEYAVVFSKVYLSEYMSKNYSSHLAVVDLGLVFNERVVATHAISLALFLRSLPYSICVI